MANQSVHASLRRTQGGALLPGTTESFGILRAASPLPLSLRMDPREDVSWKNQDLGVRPGSNPDGIISKLCALGQCL